MGGSSTKQPYFLIVFFIQKYYFTFRVIKLEVLRVGTLLIQHKKLVGRPIEQPEPSIGTLVNLGINGWGTAAIT